MSVAPWITEGSSSLPTARRKKRRVRGTVSTAPRISIVLTVLSHMVAFVAMSFLVYGLATLMGHTMKSSAYRQRLSAEFRTDGARDDVLTLGGQVGGLASNEALDRWASVHGFSRPGTTGVARDGEEETQQEE